MIKNIAHILFIACVILGFVYVRFVLGMDVADILEYFPDASLPTAAVILALYCLKAVVMVVPRTLLYIVAGAMFPIGWAIILSCTGLICEMTIGYLNGRRLGGEKIATLIVKNEKLSKYLSKQNSSDVTSCFLLRLIPFGFDIVSMFFGAAGMRFAQFIFFSLLGSAVKLVPFVLIGDSIATPFLMQFIIPFLICAILIVATILIYKKAQRRTP